MGKQAILADNSYSNFHIQMLLKDVDRKNNDPE